MDAVQILTLAIFAVTIGAVVVNRIDGTVAALIGVAAMIWVGTMTETEAFLLVDWNVMAILVGIWIIAGYFGKSGVPGWLAVQAVRLSRGAPRHPRHYPVRTRRLDLDLRRQRGHHPDDGAGGLAAGAGAGDQRGPHGADDRLQCQFHGNRAVARRPSAADAAQASPASNSAGSSGRTAGHRHFPS